MNRAAALSNAPQADSSPELVVESVVGGRQWRFARSSDRALAASGVDWFNLDSWPGAALVKRNSQRAVWRVGLQGREYFAKVYYPNGLMSRLKLMLLGATALREWNVGRYAAQRGVAAVMPVAAAWRGTRGTVGRSLLITEAVTEVRPLSDYWLDIRDDRPAAEALTDALARLIARAHQCGFRHGDLHPGNLLVRHNDGAPEVFFVDLHKVRIGRPVRFRAVSANLAQLHQWFRRHATRTQLRRFLKYYLAYRDRFARAGPLARNLAVQPDELVRHLAAKADRHARALYAKRDRRIWRTGRYFARVRPAPGWRGHVLLCSKHPAPSACAARLTYTEQQWRQWLRDPLSWVGGCAGGEGPTTPAATLQTTTPQAATTGGRGSCRAGLAGASPSRRDAAPRDPTLRDATVRERPLPASATLLKDSHTATVVRARLPTAPEPVEVIVKRPLARNLWRRLGQLLGPSRNRRSWRMANMLLNRGLPAAQPLAVVERYSAGIFRADSLMFTDFLAGAADLETFLTRDAASLDGPAQRRVKDRLIGALVALLKLFHERGFVHRDLKAPNLLVGWEAPYDGRPILTFIDMDGIRRLRRPRKTAARALAPPTERRALVRLCASLLNCPACTRADRLRFLKRYLTGPGRPAESWKAHWRQMATEVRDKLQDKDARRQWKLERYGRE